MRMEEPGAVHEVGQVVLYRDNDSRLRRGTVTRVIVRHRYAVIPEGTVGIVDLVDGAE